jgi:hypothetical protein
MATLSFQRAIPGGSLGEERRDCDRDGRFCSLRSDLLAATARLAAGRGGSTKRSEAAWGAGPQRSAHAEVIDSLGMNYLVAAEAHRCVYLPFSCSSSSCCSRSTGDHHRAQTDAGFVARRQSVLGRDPTLVHIRSCSSRPRIPTGCGARSGSGGIDLRVDFLQRAGGLRDRRLRFGLRYVGMSISRLSCSTVDPVHPAGGDGHWLDLFDTGWR